MTIQATPSEISYAADGVTTVFAIPFPFDTSADLKLTSTDASGNILTLSTGFTISGGAGLTGNATFSVAPTVGLTITIYDNPALTQPTNYVSLDAFPAESHERALDRVTRIAKRLYQLVQRSVRFPDGDVSTDGVLGSVANRKGKYLFFNAVTGAIEYAVNLVTTALSQSIIAQLLNPQTAAEAAASVTPTNYLYPASPCDVRRYGWSSSNSAAQNSTALANAIAALTPYAGGPSSVVNLPSGTFALNTAVIPAYVIVRGSSKRGTVITHTNSAGEIIFTLGGSGVSLYHGCGLSDLVVQLTGTAGTCVALQGTFGAEVSRCLFEGETISLGRTTQGVVIDGYNASAFFNHISDVSCNHLHVGFKQQSSGSQQPTQNYFTNCNGTGDVSPDTTSIGINHGDGVTSGTGQLSVYEGCNLENYNQGVHCTSVCGPAVWVGVRFEGNTTDIIYDSNASGQTLIGCNPETVKITDNTTDFRNRYFGCWVGSNATVARNQGLGIFGASAIADIPVTAIAAAGQTGDLIQAKNSALTPIAGITAAAIVYGNGLRTTAATPTGTGTQLSIGNTTAASVGAAGGASALPATPSGYLQIDIGGVKYKLPYFAN